MTKIEVRTPKVSATLRSCRAAPPKPTGDYTQKTIALYAIGLRAAHADCYAKVETTDKILTDFESEIEPTPR